MIAIKNDQYYEKLKKRQNEIIRTLEHVQKEQRTMDENKERIDKAGYKSRCQLLGSLAEWYADESARIHDALSRFREGRYGICLGCHDSIESYRLDTAPEATFCAECQRSREEPTALRSTHG
jgi:DnaK suppressor protein